MSWFASKPDLVRQNEVFRIEPPKHTRRNPESPRMFDTRKRNSSRSWTCESRTQSGSLSLRTPINSNSRTGVANFQLRITTTQVENPRRMDSKKEILSKRASTLGAPSAKPIPQNSASGQTELLLRCVTTVWQPSLTSHHANGETAVGGRAEDFPALLPSFTPPRSSRVREGDKRGIR